MEETKAAVRARLCGRLEGVRPPPIRARPPTAVRPDGENTQIKKHRHRNGGGGGFLNIGGLTWDGVCDRHEGGVQRGGHTPHCVISHNPSKAKGCDHLSECCVGRDNAQSQTGGNACGDRATWLFPMMEKLCNFLLVSLRWRNGTIWGAKHVRVFYNRLCKRGDS